MADKSFTEYVAHTFDDELWRACEEWYEENKDSVEISETHLHRMGELEVDKVNVKHVWASDLPGMRVKFEVACEVDFSVAEGDYHYDNTFSDSDWLLVCCEGDLSKELKDFKITKVMHYDGKSKGDNPLSDALVPYIRKEKLDSVAEEILRKYYPKALLEPIEVDPYELAKSMGLTVRMEYLSKEQSVFGRTFFFDCEAELYNPELDETYTEQIKAGTIIIDKQAYFMNVIGSSHNTIVHECVHWELHKKTVALARLYNSSLSNIGCEVKGGIVGNTRDSLDWIEWQANSIAPKIQMPREMFKKYVDGLITKYRRELDKYDIVDLIEPIITDISVKFGVSKTSAKIRLLEIGRKEAQGAFIYVDGEHIPPHKSDRELEINQTYSISAQDAAILSFTDKKLGETLSSGNYQYVEAHYVLNHSRYLEYDSSGNLHLTSYARNHMDECCLLFDLSIKGNIYKKYHTECFLNREAIGGLVDFDIVYHGGYENSSADKQKKVMKEYMEWTESLRFSLYCGDYSEATSNIMKKLGFSAAEVARRANINEATVRRCIKNETFNLNTYLLILLAMNLPYVISKELLDMSPGKLMPGNSDHQWYNFALMYMYQKSIGEIQKFFSEHGVKTL